METSSFIQTYQIRLQQTLDSLIPSNNGISDDLTQAMRYSLCNGGKRLRALLAYATGLTLNVSVSILDKLAAALECIHSFSLIHDDLPAMDNSDLRRGQASCHKQFNEGLAILAGDALQSLAFEIISSLDNQDLPPQKIVDMLRCLAKAIGAEGMAGGQALDIQVHTTSPNEAELLSLYRCKTGALITASIQLSCFATQAPSHIEKHLISLGDYLGLAFQIQDDILDDTSTTLKLGKTAHLDQQNNKYNFVRVFGLTQARHLCNEYYQNARDCLIQCSFESNQPAYLSIILDWLQQRDY